MEDRMSRHIADHVRTAGAARLAHFLRLARAEYARPIHIRRTPPGPQRLAAFLRIARGRSA
jgi:hypothetical protein